MKVVCILAREWGQKVQVGQTIYDIPEDGSPFEVADEHAALMLENRRKWRDPEQPIEAVPGEKAPEIPDVLLADRAGNILSAQETAEVLAKSKPEPEPKPEPKTPETPAEEPEEASEPDADEGGEDESDGDADEGGEDESDGDAWPDVSLQMTKAQLIEVAAEIGEEYPALDVKTTGTKKEIHDSILKAYDAM